MTKETVYERELRIRKKWDADDTFKRSVENRNGKEHYVFYEGPPTANGMPHAGHALGRTMKDFVARYKTMSGYQVLRKAGWDTHGLPVELEVEKQLNIRGKDEIEAYGIENFIEKCKQSVFAYEHEWKQFTEALGYWVDMDHPYVTLRNPYIESVWNILSSIHEKGYLYKGHRVVPYCPHCETSLSSHEVAQGYKDVTDLSATAKFQLVDTDNEYLLGWTTTPWTLPGNVAIAVNPELIYVRAKQGDAVYVVAESLATTVLGEEYEILEKVKGSELIGRSYKAPFEYVEVDKGHQVIAADFVTDTSGTGLVHLAPAYGEDDYHAVKDNGFDFINVVNTKGQYVNAVTPLAGKFVKDSDVDIIKMLAAKDLLFSKQKYEHSYPHCWRCDSPLLYYAMEGWFIRTTAVKEQIQANNKEVEWFPGHMKDGRFGNFLDQMVDWNIGRNRYWGTPLNVWMCQECEKEKSPRSISELREWAINEVPVDIELHKPYVDAIQFSCTCGGTMNRTSEVIDVWFDSGSMPFAQYHFPFENKELAEQQFPADVVIEGVDQTRGWFYSLLAVSTLFTGKAPYKRVLSLGHILDEHGRKMSKSKGNALSPTELIEEFGADSLRWALLADSAPWNNKRFSKQTVSQTKSKVIDTLSNAHSFYSMYARIDGFDPDRDFQVAEATMDRWVLSRLNTVVKEVKEALDAYDVTRGARTLALFLDELSNWYIRRSRQRFWASGMTSDKKAAFSTLYTVLTKTAQLMAPFAPFATEDLYSDLTGRSVHLTDFPTVDESMIDEILESKMETVLSIVEQARSIRNTVGIKTKQPLSRLVAMANAEALDLKEYAYIIQEETNVKEISFQTECNEGLELELKLNFQAAGPKLGKALGEVKQKLEQTSQEERLSYLETGTFLITLSSGEKTILTNEELLSEWKAKAGFAVSDGPVFTVLIETTLTDELKEEGIVRELIRAVQTYRKELNLPVEQRIKLYLDGGEVFNRVIQSFEGLLQKSLVLDSLNIGEGSNTKRIQVEDYKISIAIGK